MQRAGKKGDAWTYGKEDESYVTDAWKKLGGRYCYFDGNGEMTANTLIEDDRETYYVNADGVRVINQWMAMPNTGIKWEVNTIWYYFDSTGKAYRGGKKAVDGKSYLFDENGKMPTGFYYLSEVKRTGSSIPLGKEGGFYYFNESEGPRLGLMMTGKQTIIYDGVENHHYFRKDGMAYPNIIVDGNLYNPTGSLLAAWDGNDTKYSMYRRG